MNFVRVFVVVVRSSMVGDYMNPGCGGFTPCLLATFFFVFVGGVVKLVPFFPKKTGMANGVTVAVILTVYAFLTMGVFKSGRC